MMSRYQQLLYWVVWLLAGPSLLAVPGQAPSHVSYLYPAGARQGTTIELTAGGRGLRNIKQVDVSGTGVKAKAVQTVSNYKRSYGDYLKYFLKLAKAQKAGKKLAEPAEEDKLPPLPQHPIFQDLNQRSLAELQVLQKRYWIENRQKNKEMDELVLIRLTVDPDAEVGMRELRLRTSAGLSNPVRFYIGSYGELNEREPNDLESGQPVSPVPFVWNGQITPGDVDTHRFRAQAGQRLLIRMMARSITPYLADAVPGWFQATLALYDAEGNELDFSDDYRFHPDPVLTWEVPEDGEYLLRVKDALFRGREDFVYRVTVAEDRLLSHVFPLGGVAGSELSLQLYGWNLDRQRMRLKTEATASGRIRQQPYDAENRIHYGLDSLPEWMEESDCPATGRLVRWPVVLNGRIEQAGDSDGYLIHGRAGDRVEVDVLARRLQSPLDALIKLLDSKGKVLAWNDDLERMHLGMHTHHADPTLCYRLPRTGHYRIVITDTQGHGGEAFGYRMRISRPRQDFRLAATPASITVNSGCSVPVTVTVDRSGGYEGEIELMLAGAPAGFELHGATIPSHANSVIMTLSAPRGSKNQLHTIRLRGRGKYERGYLVRDVVPGRAMTQAFITPHIVPVEQMRVYVGGAAQAIDVDLSRQSRLKLKPGGEVSLRVKKSATSSGRGERGSSHKLRLKLYHAPEGVSLRPVKETKNAMRVAIRCGSRLQPGSSGNLIIEVLRDKKDKNGKVRTTSLGVIPAIPYVIEP